MVQFSEYTRRFFRLDKIGGLLSTLHDRLAAPRSSTVAGNHNKQNMYYLRPEKIDTFLFQECPIKIDTNIYTKFYEI